ncbi:hypothetical protein LL998_10885 [Burkholderia ambifaria]|uniref:hypothetical protein n=1 Tax=Burkholderia ambifaria TaxID=152480 RepID=UPI001E4771C8|nr:hypothetical protein [Burkholderia ambifaria]UEP33719.1 hypothetical protein LL998_10885 [Burkholderia ambifaria]
MSVPERHAYLLPIALRAIGAASETVDKQVWYAPLHGYQTEAMHTLLTQHGYAPAGTDNTLTKMRRLVTAGKPEAANEGKALSIGEGIHRVIIGSGRTVHYRGEARTVQVLGSRYRVKVDGRLVSLWTWLAESIGAADKYKVIELIRQADERDGALAAMAKLREQKNAERAEAIQELDGSGLFAAEQPLR